MSMIKRYHGMPYRRPNSPVWESIEDEMETGWTVTTARMITFIVALVYRILCCHTDSDIGIIVILTVCITCCVHFSLECAFAFGICLSFVVVVIGRKPGLSSWR